jgi:outer membrane lipoprotein-sorting protein
MKEKQDSIEDFSATMVITSTFGEETEISKAKIMNKTPDKSRIEFLVIYIL